MATTIPALPASQMHYPETDGKPMAETDVHRKAMQDTIETLTDFFRTAPDVYVSGNLLLYYEAGNPAASTAPDVFVARGITKAQRRTYKLWEEGRAPTVVIEFTSRSTRLEDLGNKRYLYASLGVQEYFLCDPLGEYLDPPLQGYELVDGEYIRLAADGTGSLLSQSLGLRLQHEGSRLRLIRIATGVPLLWPDEVAALSRTEAQGRMEAEGRARAEAEARRAAEERARLEVVARQEAEEQARVEAEARRASDERLAAMEAEMSALRAELARGRSESPSGAV